MTTPARSTLSEEARRAAREAPRETPAGLLGLSPAGKQAPGNIAGPRVRAVRLRLDEVVTAARGFAGAAALGVPPDGRPETVASGFTPPSPKKRWPHERIGTTEKSGPASQGPLTGITAEPEKQRWMSDAENSPRGA